MLVINLDSTKVMKCELLHKLMARRMVKMLEEDDKFGQDVHVQKRMINLGKSYNITNKYCASVSTGQFGKAKEALTKRLSTGSLSSGDETMFMAAPQGLVQAAAPPTVASSGSLKSYGLGSSGGGMKKKKKGGFAMKSAPVMKSAGMMNYASSPPMQEQRMQVSNTRWAKSKNMSSAPAPRSLSLKMPSFGRSRQSASPQQQMRSASPPSPIQMQQDCMLMANSLGSNSSLSSASDEERAVVDPTLTTGQIRDEMLMGFTVLQKTDGSFAYGPAFHKDLNMTEADLDDGAKDLNIQKDLLMTLVVLIYLRSVMANRKSSWSRIGVKADGFIAQNIAELDLNKLEESVQKFMDKFINQSRSKVLFKGYKKK